MVLWPLLACNLAQPGQALLKGRLVLRRDLRGDDLFDGLEEVSLGHEGEFDSGGLHFGGRSGALEGFEGCLGGIGRAGVAGGCAAPLQLRYQPLRVLGILGMTYLVPDLRGMFGMG